MVDLRCEAILESRKGESPGSTVPATPQFARKLIEQRGWVSDEDLRRLSNVGYGHERIAEPVANVALNSFTNHFNHVAATQVDFQPAPELAVSCCSRKGADQGE